MKQIFKVGDKVAFSQSVVRRSPDQRYTAAMRGIVLEVQSNGHVVRVDTMGTWPNEEGNSVRSIPTANLTHILRNGAVFGD